MDDFGATLLVAFLAIVLICSAIGMLFQGCQGLFRGSAPAKGSSIESTILIAAQAQKPHPRFRTA